MLEALKRRASGAITIIGAIVVFIPLVGAAPAVPVDAQQNCTESGALPSCAPRTNWNCIHGTFNIVDKCDPDGKGCLDDAT